MNTLARAAKNAALSYAWIVVSFDAWEYGLRTGRELLRWDSWPRSARSALFCLYPMYFAYSSAKMVEAFPETTAFPARKRWSFSFAMVVLFIIGTILGRRHGNASRLEN